jgi:hypothetical protein
MSNHRKDKKKWEIKRRHIFINKQFSDYGQIETKDISKVYLI